MLIRKLLTGEVKQLADDEVEVVMSTSAQARDGHILEARGVQLKNYRANPIVLWQHNPQEPIGRAEDIHVAGDKIVARVKFAPTGVSATADKVRGLVKNDIVRGVSIGFDVEESEPLDPARPRTGGLRITKAEILECSFVSVPADTGAQVTARELDGTTTRALHRGSFSPDHLEQLQRHHATAHHELGIVAGAHGQTLGGIARCDEIHGRLLLMHDALTKALANNDVEGARQLLRPLDRHITDLGDEAGTLHEHHNRAATSQRAARRAVSRAAAIVRSVLDDSTDPHQVVDGGAQVGDGYSDGSSDGTAPPRSLSFAQRQRDLARLRPPAEPPTYEQRQAELRRLKLIGEQH
jgi:HK97 family phage prohead protease